MWNFLVITKYAINARLKFLYVTLYCREVVYEDLFVKLENFPGILQEKKVHTFCVLLDGVFILDWFFASGNS